MYIYSFPASDNFCRLLVTFANSLDTEQNRQKVCPESESKKNHGGPKIIYLKSLILKINGDRSMSKNTQYAKC